MFSLGGPNISGINVEPFTTNTGFNKSKIYWDTPQDPVLCIFENVMFPTGILEYETKKVVNIRINDEIIGKLNEIREHIMEKAKYPNPIDPERQYFPLKNNILTVKVTQSTKIFRNDKESVEHIPQGIRGTAYVKLNSLWLINNMTGFTFYLDSVYFKNAV